MRSASGMDLKTPKTTASLAFVVPEKGTGQFCSNRNTIPFTF